MDSFKHALVLCYLFIVITSRFCDNNNSSTVLTCSGVFSHFPNISKHIKTKTILLTVKNSYLYNIQEFFVKEWNNLKIVYLINNTNINCSIVEFFFNNTQITLYCIGKPKNITNNINKKNPTKQNFNFLILCVVSPCLICIFSYTCTKLYFFLYNTYIKKRFDTHMYIKTSTLET
jgi:hypothetical protein